MSLGKGRCAQFTMISGSSEYKGPRYPPHDECGTNKTSFTLVGHKTACRYHKNVGSHRRYTTAASPASKTPAGHSSGRLRTLLPRLFSYSHIAFFPWSAQTSAGHPPECISTRASRPRLSFSLLPSADACPPWMFPSCPRMNVL